MKILFDTSVMVSAMVEPHPAHGRALPWLKRAKAGEFDLFVASHSLAELYAVLTTLPVRPRISPRTAWRLIHEDVETLATIVPLSKSDYESTIRHISDMELSGGIVYDALIVQAAKKSGADHILTLNTDDFKNICPDVEDFILEP